MLDGMAKVDMLAAEVKRQGMPAVGITDHGNMFGSDAFYQKMVAEGIKPIIGIEAYLAPESRFNKNRIRWGEPHQKSDDVSASGAYLHQTMIAETATGLQNLFYLSSMASYEGQLGKWPRMDADLIAENATGIIATTGCPSGDVQTRLRLGQFDEALEAAAMWQDIYGKENYFLELMDHGLDIENRVRSELLEIGRKLDLPPLVTNDCHYVLQDQAHAHEVMLCVQTGKTMQDPDRFKFDGDGYFIKSAAEMRATWDNLVPGACDNTLLIAERVQDYSKLWEAHPHDRMPIASVPDGHTPTSWLTHEVMEGLKERFDGGIVPQVYIDRANYEIEVIDMKGYPSYFLIVADLIKHARSIGIRVGPGRGSAAGALVAYALTITNIDPIKHGLLFERFLNPERPSAPDIDIDFDDRRRGEMIRYAADNWGEDKVAQVITFGTVKTKQALKDSARALFGQPGYQIADRITKALPPAIMAKDIPLSGIMDPEHERYGEAGEVRGLIENDPDVRNIYETARGLEGVVRQAGVHACAVIMASVPLLDCIPMWKRPADGALITGWPYPSCEAIGLLKMDFLGLRNLTVIGDCIENIKTNRGIDLDLEALETEDVPTYELLSRGDTLGVFQLDSGGMRELLKRMEPTCFDDIVAALALYRPGPMGVGAYADRKNGREEITPIHPELEEPLREILDETYGLIVYQEQIMRISQKVANYTAGQADGFRKAMGKKKPEVLAKEFVTFEAGMKENGFSSEAIKALWDTIEPFAAYAFNKSHAAGYGLVSFWTGYLKANYTSEYMAALLTSVADRKDKSAIYLADCRHLGIRVLSPDVNESAYTYQSVGEDIRFGLGAVRNVGEDVVASIVNSRGKIGKFKDFSHYLESIDTVACSKRVTESLIKAGAFDSLGHPRKGLALIHEDAVDAVISTKKAADKGQFDLFAGFGDSGGDSGGVDNFFAVQVPDEEWERKHELALEREMLGLYVSGHPLDGYEEAIAAQTDTELTTILGGELKHGAEVVIGGIISSVDRRFSKKDGSPWAIVTVEDHNGASVELLVFNKLYALVSPQIVEDNIILAKAHISIRDDRMSLFCDDLKTPDLGPGNGAGLPLRLTMRTDQCTMPTIAKLKQVLVANSGDSDVYLKLVDGDESTLMILGDHLRVTRSASLMGDLKAAMGPGILG